MRASLVIPTYNKLGRLRLTVESIKHQTVSEDEFEVIIIDDGSSDGTAEFLETEDFPFCCRIFRQQNKGRACARNKGIQNSENEIIIFTDDDLILDKDFIKNHIKNHEIRKQVVHGKILNLPRTKFFKDPVEGTFLDYLDIRPKVKESLKNERIFPSMIMDEADFKKYITGKSKITALEELIRTVLTEYPGKMDWVSFVGGNVSVAKEILEEVNGFDENFGLQWGCEDVELGYRLMLRKIPFHYADDAGNYHIAHYRADFSEEHTVNMNYFYEKYKDPAILLFHDFISGKITIVESLMKIRNTLER